MLGVCRSSCRPYIYVARNTRANPIRKILVMMKSNTKTDAIMDTMIDSDVAKPYTGKS